MNNLMIRYRLHCDRAHEFEAWFQNSDTFDRQAGRGQVACPDCGSTKVEKSLMAPNVVTTKARASPVPAPSVESAAAKSERVRLANANQRELLRTIRRLRDEVVAKSEYVGPRFAEEARKIHNEEKSARGIYGEASPDEVKELAEDGVEVYPLPVLPEDHN